MRLSSVYYIHVSPLLTGICGRASTPNEHCLGDPPASRYLSDVNLYRVVSEPAGGAVPLPFRVAAFGYREACTAKPVSAGFGFVKQFWWIGFAESPEECVLLLRSNAHRCGQTTFSWGTGWGPTRDRADHHVTKKSFTLYPHVMHPPPPYHHVMHTRTGMRYITHKGRVTKCDLSQTKVGMCS